jgi:hypothetical protein
MEIPRYLQILWQYKWFLALGILISLLVGIAAGYRLEGGQLVSRAESSYSASVTMLLGSERESLFEAEIPGQTIQEGATAPIRRDLAATAVVYAYLVTSTEMRDLIEEQVGELGESESLTAVRRSTQPGGDERFPGRYDLPILDVVGYSDDSARAEEIAGAAGDVFVDYVVEQQDAAQVAPEARIKLAVISRESAEQLEGSNPLVPVVVGAFGVFAVFVALVFVLYNWQTTRSRAPRRPEAADGTPGAATGTSGAWAGLRGMFTRRGGQHAASREAPRADVVDEGELAGVGGEGRRA